MLRARCPRANSTAATWKGKGLAPSCCVAAMSQACGPAFPLLAASPSISLFRGTAAHDAAMKLIRKLLRPLARSESQHRRLHRRSAYA
jgi:hypothetical protein